MFFQKFLALIALVSLLAVVHADADAEAANEYTVTVKTDVFSTEVAYVTMTGEPPVEKPIETGAPS